MSSRSGLLLLLLAAAACPGGAPPRAVAEAREVEPNDDFAHALVLTGGYPLAARGEIASTKLERGVAAGDRDLYRFTLPETGWLVVTLTEPSASDYDLAVFDAGGRRRVTARSDNRDPSRRGPERLYARLTGGRDYYLEVAGCAGPPGPYSFRIDLRPRGRPGPAGPVRTGALNLRRSFHALVALPDGRAVVGGGTTEAGSRPAALLHAIASTELFDPATGRFTGGPDLGVARFGPTGTLLPDGRVLFAGGDVAGTAAIYDPDRNVVTDPAVSLVVFNRFLPTATLLPDGRVLLAGGVRLLLQLPPRAVPLATTELFDPKTNRFSSGPALLHHRFSHAACLLLDGRVLISGGEGLGNTEVLDLTPGSEGSRPGPPMTGVRDDHTATTLADGRVLVTGGQNAAGRSQATAEILDDPAAGPGSAFRRLPSRMADARSDHQALRLPDGSVLIFGGECDPGTNQDAILDSVDRFDPADESFHAWPALLVPRDDSRIAMLLDGRILVTGGEDVKTHSIPDAELYPVPRAVRGPGSGIMRGGR